VRLGIKTLNIRMQKYLHIHTLINFIILIAYFYIDINHPEVIDSTPQNIKFILISTFTVTFIIGFYLQLKINIEKKKSKNK